MNLTGSRANVERSRYHRIIKGVPFFRALEEGAIIKLCGLLKPFTAMAEDLIYKRGAAVENAFFLFCAISVVLDNGRLAKTGSGQETEEKLRF
eukprot:COSAG06_NODE_429_length_15872_cov_25.578330_17_plen_93_part_00